MNQLIEISKAIEKNMPSKSSINIHIEKDKLGNVMVCYSINNDVQIVDSVYFALKEIIQRITV